MEKQLIIKEDKIRVISSVHQKMLSGQKRLADHLNFKCRNISSKGLLAMLITFSALTSALILRLIIRAVY